MLLLLSRGRQDDAGEVLPARIAAHGGEDVQSREMRHHQVQQDQTEVAFARQDLESLATIIGEGHPEGTLFQLHLDDPADVRLVVSDEHVTRRGSQPYTSAAMCSRLRRSSYSSWPMSAFGCTRT